MDTSRWGLPVRRVERRSTHELDPAEWPATVPAVAQVLREGLDLGSATVLVGENGAGKSTVVEAVAGAFGLNPEGGSVHRRHSTRASESPLGGALQVVRGPGGSRWGFFLRAEAMHGFYSYLEDPDRGGEESGSRRSKDPAFHEMSHGESFRALLDSSRYDGSGFYCFDEPESALSFTSQLALLAQLTDLVAGGAAQVLMATHSPVLAALPGARLLLVDDAGLTETAWDDLPIVAHWRAFLDDPRRYLRHL